MEGLVWFIVGGIVGYILRIIDENRKEVEDNGSRNFKQT